MVYVDYIAIYSAYVSSFDVLFVIKTRKQFMLSISKDLKCFCLNYIKSSDREKKSKHIKPLIKLLHQLIVSCREQPEVIYCL